MKTVLRNISCDNVEINRNDITNEINVYLEVDEFFTEFIIDDKQLKAYIDALTLIYENKKDKR